ncbi:DJ-1/PfpI family protein [Saccharophagus degradans]|uniref:ThiJ/PfpI n=1 Tax=Saccharophagus degradans (strain 2-40 / ATCC 43961 / DSM 17024) TaxID=203122 RepID=Q21F60_SACD2|nr:DJ-1/PfpI family protein [Saccharophagus degradans]ABD82669.1 ThiJ/PfpI [Saccharophagus degradans 2-40]
MINIGIYIYDRAEVLDFSGPFEVFSTATRMCENDTPFNVFLVAQQLQPVVARGGYRVLPEYDFSNHPSIDLLLVVGGVHTDEMDKSDVVAWLALQATKAKWVASVCTGAFLLAQAGIITDQSVTTHWEDIADLRKQFPALNVQSDVRWVDEGRLTTSAGISAGIDMSLFLVSKLHSKPLAEATARQMEYDWVKSNA